MRACAYLSLHAYRLALSERGGGLSPVPPKKGLIMYLVLDKEDYDTLAEFEDIANKLVTVAMFSDSKRARTYCREIISDELAHDETPSTFVILEISKYHSHVVTGKLGVIISSRDLK